MDASWLEIVRERSQFLFLQLWRAADWADNARPFVSLTLCILILDEPRARRLGASALLIGATGLSIGLIGILLGPVGVLVQGQTWRWVWVTSLIAVLMSAPAALRGWKVRYTGPVCALLMMCGWMMEAEVGSRLHDRCAAACGSRAIGYQCAMQKPRGARPSVWVC